MKFTQQEMFAVMKADDARYDGQFFVCVRTTKIYCLPSCKAKLPLSKNVEFAETREEAMARGFRGCKRCRAEFFPNTQPSWLDDVLHRMRDAQSIRLTEGDLARTAHVDISTVRRYFRSYMNTTPLAFHRKVRLQHAHAMMKRGVDYLTAAYETGFESASGFRDAYVRHYGYPPGRTNGA